MERNKSKAPYGTQIKNGLLDAQDYVESLALFLIMSMVSGLGCQRRKVALWEGRRQWDSRFTPLVSVANF